MKETLIERLVRYTKVNTRSDGNSVSVPSTKIQFDLSKILYDECVRIGLEKVKVDEYGIVTALLPSNVDGEVPTIGFISHMDTADYNSENVQPRIIENYDGKDIVLNESLNIVTAVDVFPSLKNHVGKTLVVTDGTTLLGADDKAGIAEIMTAMEYLVDHPEITHGDVRVAFTIDEEIGTGADSFDVEGFNADFAYTVDGGGLGEMEYETFNAAETVVTIKGVSVHPGSAKDTMINAAVVAHEYFAGLPAADRPEHTEGYEGFFLLTEMQTTIEDARMVFIIRDHDKNEFEARKKLMDTIAHELNNKYGNGTVNVATRDSYYNMRNIIEEDMSVVELAKDAMKSVGLEPIIEPVRGGTDGSRLSYMGLPTPNLFTGGENFHGKHEFAVVESMEKATEVIIAIAHLNAAR
ncbi:peptidase T [Erysipelothrix sp. HDW6C]|uniref:peptidase T n=1 Tax=Erysipelothrix sp. HDW6C TaxID=2714930 RepID=UPI00140C4E2C|nr:peptidase T [Erysipelothrix sp. HDW6C]QIK70903.1 peptidase T [Erysipelothrix sp. HDW6C]